MERKQFLQVSGKWSSGKWLPLTTNYSTTNQTKKLGISLIAVLMFMLAATTASIVVFRWVGQENFASGARLKNTEAEQASQAGLEAVRGWMTTNGAEVGALIRRYEQQTGSKKPVALGDALGATEFLGNNSKQQNFEVYLAGVDTSKTTYKLKFISDGFARDGSKHSQVGIFDVAGLYRVNVTKTTPPQRAKPGIVDEFALWASGNVSWDGGGENNPVTSAVIQGNWKGNPPRFTGDFVVTGDVELDGKDFQVGGTACIGRDLSLNNNDLGSGEVYVGRDFKNANGIFKNTFVERNIEQSSARFFQINGNLEVANGQVKPTTNTLAFTVNGNLVLGDLATLLLTNQQNPNERFIVTDSVWIPNSNGIRCNGTCGDEYAANRRLGNKTSSLLAVRNLSNNNYNEQYEIEPIESSNQICVRDYDHTNKTYTGLRRCFDVGDGTLDIENIIGVNISVANRNAFQQTGSTVRFYSAATNIDNLAIDPRRRPSGAQAVKDYCDEIWNRVEGSETGCGSDVYVEDIIKTSINTFRDYAANNKCAGLGETHTYGTGTVALLNSCYTALSSNPDNLFNGFLVVNLRYNNMTFPSNNAVLNGKFIFIFDEKANATFVLPPLTEESMAMIYFAEGVSGSPGIRPVNVEGCDEGRHYNYFIYSLGPVGKIQHFKKECPIKGTVYFPTKDPETGELKCGKYGTLDVQEAAMETNTDLLRALEEAGVICNPSDPDCGTPKDAALSSSSTETSSSSDGGEGGGGTGGGTTVATEDTYHVPLTPNLKVTLHSQYVNKETKTENIELTPSILVIPRVLHVPKDVALATITSGNYYNVLYLNGATKGTPSTSCPNYKPDAPDTYSCTVTASGLSVPFWIKVMGEIEVEDDDPNDPDDPDDPDDPNVTKLLCRDFVSSGTQGTITQATLVCTKNGPPSDMEWIPSEISELGIGTHTIKARANCGTERLEVNCGTLRIDPAPTEPKCVLPKLIAGRSYSSPAGLEELRRFITCDEYATRPTSVGAFTSTTSGDGTPIRTATPRIVAAAGNYANVKVMANCGVEREIECNNVTVLPATVNCHLGNLSAGSTFNAGANMTCSNGQTPTIISLKGTAANGVQRDIVSSSKVTEVASEYSNIVVEANCGTNANPVLGACEPIIVAPTNQIVCNLPTTEFIAGKQYTTAELRSWLKCGDSKSPTTGIPIFSSTHPLFKIATSGEQTTEIIGNVGPISNITVMADCGGNTAGNCGSATVVAPTIQCNLPDELLAGHEYTAAELRNFVECSNGRSVTSVPTFKGEISPQPFTLINSERKVLTPLTSPQAYTSVNVDAYCHGYTGNIIGNCADVLVRSPVICGYQPSWCNNVYADALNVPSPSSKSDFSNNYSTQGKCFFVSNVSSWNGNDVNGGKFNVNGAPCYVQQHQNPKCSEIAKVDNGYYIYVKNNLEANPWEFNNGYNATPECDITVVVETSSSSAGGTSSSSSGGSSSSVAPSSSSVAPSSSSVAQSSSSAGGGGGSCDYDPSWCGGVTPEILTSGITINQDGAKCVFLRGVNGFININNNNSKVNGSSVAASSIHYNNAAFNSLPKADGGYYFYIPSWNYVQIDGPITGSPDNGCP